MRVFDLFSGIGGFSLGLERAGMTTVGFCEIEKYPVSILRKHWPDVPIFNDIKRLDSHEVLQQIGQVDLICGGFPCQPFSVAGKQRGETDDRHLWPYMLRLIAEIRPRWVIAENVAGFIPMGLDSVLSSLEAEGYETQSFVIPACAVGGIHRRNRVWIVAHTQYHGLTPGQEQGGDGKAVCNNPQRQNCTEQSEGVCAAAFVANTQCTRLEGQPWSEDNARKRENAAGPSTQSRTPFFHSEGFRPLELPAQPPVCHRDDGLPNRVARLKALGNAVVPQIPELIGRAILAIEKKYS
ncbi:MAG: DNA cytosine methyltransferase [Methylococcales bacterium]|jgi:DNA (cytosine-5)-methyltransferase 1|nr:DNA cytosine methyltransferase [Methylococcales bacterium]